MLLRTVCDKPTAYVRTCGPAQFHNNLLALYVCQVRLKEPKHFGVRKVIQSNGENVSLSHAGLGPGHPRSTLQHDPNSFTDRETDHNKGAWEVPYPALPLTDRGPKNRGQ